jgi:ribonuclease VapC
MNQNQLLLDASALLATLYNETGGDYVEQVLDTCIISSVNWSEVLQKINRSGGDINTVSRSLTALGLQIIDFTEQDAKLAASLFEDTKKLGLSLADRACLATGIRLNAKIVTADRIWREVACDLQMHFIR